MRGKAVCVLMIGLGLTLSACARRRADGAERRRADAAGGIPRADGCAMTADVRCDRENEVENYTLQCDWNADGSARVEVLAPETLVGIAAEFNGDDLSLHYDDMSLAAGPVSSQELTRLRSCLWWWMPFEKAIFWKKGQKASTAKSACAWCLTPPVRTTENRLYSLVCIQSFAAARGGSNGGKTVFTVTFSEFSAAEGTADGSV